MKNIKSFVPEKYSGSVFKEVEDGIYFAADEYSTCLSFEQEPKFGESDSPKTISQYPLEDILDKFFVYVSDFFEEQNAASKDVCYLEFCSSELNDIKELRTLIGKTARDIDNALKISD